MGKVIGKALLCALVAAALGLSQAQAAQRDGAIFPGYSPKILPDDSVYARIGDEEGMDPMLLYAVSLTEAAYNAGVKGYVKPSLYAIRTPAGPIYPKTLEEAKSQLVSAVKSYGRRSIDVGLMQINGQHWHRLGLPVFALFNPNVNVRFGARILQRAINSAPGNFAVGVGHYHSWTPSRAGPYGRKVLSVYRNLKGLE